MSETLKPETAEQVLDAVKWAVRAAELGAGELLVTSMDTDGQQTGYDLELLRAITEGVSIPVIASGGVKGLDDIHVLSLYANEGIEGVITGRALYDGRLDLAAALAMAARQ